MARKKFARTILSRKYEWLSIISKKNRGEIFNKSRLNSLQILNEMSDYYNNEDILPYDDSIDSGATEKDNGTSINIFDECELILVLGVDNYHEIMFRIEEQIKDEFSEVDCYNLNQDLDIIQSEELICPNCMLVYYRNLSNF